MKKNSPVVSVIVPCYNQGKYLSETLDSVITQSYENWECLIINDGSTDHTEEVCLTYTSRDNRFKYIKQENTGLSSARNKGIQLAKGQYIQLLDSDDLIEYNKIDILINEYDLIEENHHTILYSSMRYFEDGFSQDLKIVGRDNFIGHVELKKYDSIASQLELLKSRNLCVISAPIYPREIFEAIGIFDIHFSALEDWEFHLRCCLGGIKFHHISYRNANTLIRLHNTSMSRNKDLMNENYQNLAQKYFFAETISASNKKDNILVKIARNILPPILLKLVRFALNRATSSIPR